MKTPAGKECPQYYADFHRGRSTQKCRLAERNADSAPWNPHDCTTCPVPDILLANSSPSMRLRLTIKAGILGFGRRLQVEAYCEKHSRAIDDPFVGCPRCNAERPGLDLFREALDKPERDEQP
jgi:hypothetical protein